MPSQPRPTHSRCRAPDAPRRPAPSKSPRRYRAGSPRSTDTGHDGVTVVTSDSLRPPKGRRSIPAVDEKQLSPVPASPDAKQLVELFDTKDAWFLRGPSIQPVDAALPRIEAVF